MNLCVIPARIGSKRIPKKNIKIFHGKPMIAWAIDNAKKTKLFKKIIVSTDSLEIKKIAEDYGAECPFIRPDELANDNANTSSVIKHSVEWFNKKKIIFDYICCIYPCTPMLSSSVIKKGLEAIKNNSSKEISFAAGQYRHPIQRSFSLDQNNTPKLNFPKEFLSRSQDIEKSYYDAGQFYWASNEFWQKKNIYFDNSSIAIKLPEKLSIDIDEQDDWDYIEKIFEK